MSEKLSLPQNLPISDHAGEIMRAIRSNPVVIVSGDTGSGKTTQLPKIAMNAGCGSAGLIGCTQPRRLATQAMANRVAAELNGEAGGFVGYQHRFENKVSRQTKIKFMTDGILLAETRRDRFLKSYDTLIIDEAHERSLNIDFLLGILKRILRKRRDLKVIISSATLDVQRFSDFFDQAPVVQVPGRLHPIELRWRPPLDSEDADLSRCIADGCDELMCEGDGDILVFLPGEHDIRDATETLRGRFSGSVEIIPLLASLPSAEQARAFRLSAGRRIVLSTNVAETSVTVPGIRYVIDSGLVRLNRYSHRTQVQRLLVERISQASADQRMGRCGRTAPGICIRLYDEEDFRKRDYFTVPEILRTSLASVILTMMDLKLGVIDEFPFIEPPSDTIVNEGYRKLHLLGAIRKVAGREEGHRVWRLTHLGRRMARFPVGPVLSAILLSGERERALREILIIVAALECENPKRRPVDKRDEADRCHARFLSPVSDFSALLNLWRWYIDAVSGLSQSRTRRLCSENFLSYPKMREWIDLHAQLRRICLGMKLDVESHAGGESGVHRALLSGLLSNIGKLDLETGEYQGTRGTRFAIHPGSGLAAKRDSKHKKGGVVRTADRVRLSHDWIVADDLVETSRLFARQVACVAPEWIEHAAQGHCRFQYWAAHWDGRRGFVSCKERVTFQGVVIADGRNRDFGRIDPEAAREIFIREGLVGGDFPQPLPAFLKHNLSCCRALRDADAKTRRTGVFFDPEPYCNFYARKLPSHICNAAALRKWLNSLDKEGCDALMMSGGDLPADPQLTADFPDFITIQGCRFKLSYYFEHGAEDDGLTCAVPVEQLKIAAQWPADWLVPGMLDDKLRWMISVLPSRQRRVLQPLDEIVAECRSLLRPGQGSLYDAVAAALYQIRAVRVLPDTWRRTDWPPHLIARFLVYSEDGEVLGFGRDINALLRKFGDAEIEVGGAKADELWNLSGLKEWDCDDLPEEVDIGCSGWPLIQYPALVDRGSCVDLRLFAERKTALSVHRAGTGRLIALMLGKVFKRYLQPPSLPRDAAHQLVYLNQSVREIGEEIGFAALHHCFTDGQPAIRSRAELERRIESCYPALHDLHLQRTRLVVAALREAAQLQSLLESTALPPTTLDDMTEQLAWLVFPGFAGSVPYEALQHYPRYFEACRIRLARVRINPDADFRRTAEIVHHWQRYQRVINKEKPVYMDSQILDEYRWLLEEYRVSLFAQELKTARPVSAKRLDKLWHNITG